MTSSKVSKPEKGTLRTYPKLTKTGEKEYVVEAPEDLNMENLMGVRTQDAANGIYLSAISALGRSAEKNGAFASAMFAEMEPKDALEAMLLAQMTATHVTLTHLAEKLSFQTSYQVRESCERSMTRLSRTYLAQMEALKKYRAKAQQVVRVERVTVNEGGQAIVGDVSHTEGGR